MEGMRRSGITHGSIYEIGWFEQRLSCHRNSLEFDLAVSSIQTALERSGFYIHRFGQHGGYFLIVAHELNLDQMLAYERQAIEILGRGIALGANTRLHLLWESRQREPCSSVAVRSSLKYF